MRRQLCLCRCRARPQRAHLGPLCSTGAIERRVACRLRSSTAADIARERHVVRGTLQTLVCHSVVFFLLLRKVLSIDSDTASHRFAPLAESPESPDSRLRERWAAGRPPAAEIADSRPARRRASWCSLFNLRSSDSSPFETLQHTSIQTKNNKNNRTARARSRRCTPTLARTRGTCMRPTRTSNGATECSPVV